MPDCIPKCLSDCLPTYMPVCLPTYMPVWLPTYMPVCLPPSLSALLFIKWTMIEWICCFSSKVRLTFMSWRPGAPELKPWFTKPYDYCKMACFQFHDPERDDTNFSLLASKGWNTSTHVFIKPEIFLPPNQMCFVWKKARKPDLVKLRCCLNLT